MTSITEYRDGYINQIGASKSSFRIDGNVYSSVKDQLVLLGNLKNITFSSNQSITFTNQTDLLNNTCRMYWSCLGNNIEYDLISQVFDKDIIVSKQLLYLPETAGSGDIVGDIMTDHDGNNAAPFDARFGNAAVRLLPNSNNHIRLYGPSDTYDANIGKPDWWLTNEIAPYFDGLEISFVKTDSTPTAGEIYNNTINATIFYHNNTTRAANPAGHTSNSTFKFRPRQQIRAKIIKIGLNPVTYGWHIMESKTPAP